VTRDRLLFAVLHDTGMRIGEALRLRHADWAAAERTVAVTPRSNDNGARAKSGQPRTIPTSPGLVRLYADYLPVPRLVIRHASIIEAKQIEPPDIIYHRALDHLMRHLIEPRKR